LAGLQPSNLPFPLVARDPHLPQCVPGPAKCSCKTACRSVERFKQSARVWQTTDRQTTLRRNA